jgi:predicted anti-sigma-YlaC factor YlaD
MNCTRIRHAVSARLDGEDPGLDTVAIDAHLERCSACRAFAGASARFRRAGRLTPAPEVPDLTPRIVAAIGRESRAPARGGDMLLALRWILVGLALAQIGVAVPALFLGSDAGVPVHTARHLGSFDVAVAVGFLFAAWRPSRIPGLLPVVAALVACLFGSSLLDVFSGNTAALGEAHHAIDVVGLAVLWVLGRGVVGPVVPPRRDANPGLA